MIVQFLAISKFGLDANDKLIAKDAGLMPLVIKAIKQDLKNRERAIGNQTG